MSVKKAQGIANRIQDRMAFNVTAYSLTDIEWLKEQLELFVDTEVEPEELTDPDEFEESMDAFNGLGHDQDESDLEVHDE